MSNVDLHTGVPHSARIYDYLLGGKDNFEADRQAAAAIVKNAPNVPHSMRANRQYMVRSAHYLAAELGIRQFLDIGTGIPTAPNLHEVVQRVAPDARVAYVDNDPIVLVHARALLTSSPEGATAYVDADLHDVHAILHSEDLVRTIDFSSPVAVSLNAILQFFTDEDEVHRILDELVAPLCPGSALSLTTLSTRNPESIKGAEAYRARGIPMKARTDDEVEALFRGLEVVAPGVTLVHRWHPDAEAAATDDAHVMMSGGVAVVR